jgi:hypothetical protein
MESGPADGSVRSGVPKKFMTCGQAPGILIDGSAGIREPSVPSMSELTRILSAIDQGDPHAASQLLPMVYDELRKLAAQKLAHERPGQTLQPTALVHEAYLRLFAEGEAQLWALRHRRLGGGAGLVKESDNSVRRFGPPRRIAE